MFLILINIFTVYYIIYVISYDNNIIFIFIIFYYCLLLLSSLTYFYLRTILLYRIYIYYIYLLKNTYANRESGTREYYMSGYVSVHMLNKHMYVQH